MLLSSAKQKDFEKVRHAVEQGAGSDSNPIDLRDDQGYTALIYACGLSLGIPPSRDIAAYLIERGADVNAKSVREFTPLSEACAYGALDVVELLLDAGADPNLGGQYDMSPLMFGATSSHWSGDAARIVKALLEHGADPNLPDKYGNNPLLKSIDEQKPDLAVAKLLIDGGTDLEHVGPYETTALRNASKKGFLELVTYLVEKGAEVDAKNKAGETALVEAMKGNHKAVVDFLLQSGADPEIRRRWGGGLLEYAAEYGHPDLLKWIKPGEDQDAKEALLQASRKGHLEFIQALASRGVNPGMDFGRAESPLMKAAREGHRAVAEYLLDQGADLEARSHKGHTPLFYAAWEGRLEMLKLLLERGADLHAENDLGWTALFQTCDKGHHACMKHLIGLGAQVNLVEKEQGVTPLMVAAAGGHAECVSLLLEAGADTRVIARNGRTALTWARGKRQLKVVALLEGAHAALPPEPEPGSTQEGLHCAFCRNSLTEATAKENHCKECDAPYCAQHFPWSEWQLEHITSDARIREAMCPYGHVKYEYER